MLIDGRPAGDYQLRGLRAATALLSQDHTLFPVPVRENIALGRPDDTVSQAAVEDAARLGGAHAFIGKLRKAYATDLQPVKTKGSLGIAVHSPLMKVYEKLEKQTDVSGASAGACGRSSAS
jgi:ABC-type multidrug transport system fused ATPase/permease subunit